MVDRARTERREGRLYVVRSADGLVVKRARRSGDIWILESDHPAWSPTPWPEDALTVGEVRWMVRSFG